ncbi:hypothetical protein QBE53_06110 [Vallitaleaceae bacterium 9-2]
MDNNELITVDGKEVDDSLIITFKKPYTFEGTTYEELDMNGLEDFSTEQFELAERQYTNSGSFSAIPEMTVGFAKYVASVITKKPIEFFNGLPANEMVKVKNVCVGYFYN